MSGDFAMQTLLNDTEMADKSIDNPGFGEYDGRNLEASGLTDRKDRP
jgi:hypothetical protein